MSQKQRKKAKRPGRRGKDKGGRGRRRSDPQVLAEEAARYGLRVPREGPAGERFISPNQAARILGLTGEAVKQWIYRRKLPAIKLPNGYWKIKIADLEAFLRVRTKPGSKRVLLLAADGCPQEVLDIIGALGHEIILAHNPTDALLKARDLAPALFLAEVSEGREETWLLLERIRKAARVRNLSVLLLSRRELSRGHVNRALSLGIQGLLRWPVEPRVLKEEIRKLL